MIQEVTMYQAVCDRCGKLHGQMFETPQLCAKIALWRGWFVENHNIYCPDCVEYDEETDSYKPKKENGNEKFVRIEIRIT